MGGNPDVLRIAQLKIVRYQVWAIPRLAILTFTHSTAYGTYYKLQILNKMFFFLTWLNFGSSLNTLPRVIIRTGFAQFLSPIDFCFLLQLSLTHSNYNLGNWQELIWLHFVKSQNSWTTSIQFNNNCSSFSINIIGNNNYCSSKVQQHWQNCRFQKSEFCILQKYWHVEIFTLSSLL